MIRFKYPLITIIVLSVLSIIGEAYELPILIKIGVVLFWMFIASAVGIVLYQAFPHIKAYLQKKF